MTDLIARLEAAEAGSGGMIGESMFGFQVIVSAALPTTKREPYPRSPARAKRRARIGHPQHTRLVADGHAYLIGKRLFVSDAAFASLRAMDAAP